MRYRRNHWMPVGTPWAQEHPTTRDDSPDDDFGRPAQLVPGYSLVPDPYGDCTRRTSDGQCGFPLDVHGSCGVESRHTGAS